MLHRRQILKMGTAVLTASMFSSKLPALPLKNAIQAKKSIELAKNEDFWRVVSGYYQKAQGIVNLEHGYWGKMSLPVINAFENHTRKVNQQGAFYARKQYADDFANATQRVANSLGVNSNEVALTRNASEAFVNLITQYNNLKSGDTVMWADTDYLGFQDVMEWLIKERNLKGVKITIPVRANEKELLAIYHQYITKYPTTKLLLLTHVSNHHGLTFPIKKIADFARSHTIDVICDCAQSWGLIDYELPELGVDWAVFNLHKWIGSPVGVGALYMKSGTLHKVNPFPGQPLGNDTVANRVDLATSDFASFLTIPDALDFRSSIGARNIESRLRYLRSLWIKTANQLPTIEVLGATTEATASGLGAIRIRGQKSKEENIALQQLLERDFGIFTVARHGMSTGSCVRITPHLCTTVEEIQKLNKALIAINDKYS